MYNGWEKIMKVDRAWEYTIDFVDIWEKFHKDMIWKATIGKQVANRIRESTVYSIYKETLEPIAQKFEITEDVEEFDDVLESLYVFGDTNRRCWIKTR